MQSNPDYDILIWKKIEENIYLFSLVLYDIAVKQSYDDLIKNRDTQLNAALDYIKKAAVK